MTNPAPPRRSVLYVPGNNDRALQKASKLAADVFILDLEDAVDEDAKTASRERVCEVVRAGSLKPREVVVRVNGLGTNWHEDDIRALAETGVDAILVPKVSSAQEVRELVEEMDDAGTPAGTSLWVMVETPAAFLRAEEIASASERLSVLVIGTNDLVNDLHAIQRPGRFPVSTALSLAVLGARSAGKVVLDGVFNDLGDESGFAAEAQQGRDMGFDGKTVVHPSQIGPANSTFGPSPEEISYARAVVSAFAQARSHGKSVATVDGKMIESLHVRDAQRLLDLAAQIDALTDLVSAGSPKDA